MTNNVLKSPKLSLFSQFVAKFLNMLIILWCLFPFYSENNRKSKNQWGFKPSDSCVICFYLGGSGFSNITGGILSWEDENNWGIHLIPYMELLGAQWFWNSLNLLNCSAFFLVLEMYSKKSTFSDLFWNCYWIQNFWQSPFRLQHSWLRHVWISHLWYFNSALGNLKNRTSHQVTVGPNCSWISFLKLPYVLDTLWPIIATPDYFPVFQNKKDNEVGIVPLVVML